MAGYNIVNACTSYIIDKNEDMKMFYKTSQMNSKLDSIDRYLDKHFDTDAKVDEFMEAFIKGADSNESNIKED